MDLPRALDRPVARVALTILVVLVGVGARLPMVATADDLDAGHPDAGTYFWKAATVYAEGRLEPLPHGGSGWPLLLASALRVFGVELAPPAAPGEDLVATPETVLFAYALHALLAAGVVVATLVLARRLLPPLQALLASALVALDPFLLGHATSLMADGLYTILVLLAIACVAGRPDDPWRLAVAGALMALAHMVRVNGLVMLAMVVAFAAWQTRASGRRLRWRHLAIPVAAFALVAAPYLAWRAEHLPGAFDYGTNQRFWTDDPWDMSDAYWSSYSIAEGGERESMSDYFATHSLGEAARRAGASILWQVEDVAVGAFERAVLAPTLLALAAAGLLVARGSGATRAFALCLAFTMATFFWIYPAVRSPRYFMPLVPLAAILAAQAMAWVARVTRQQSLVVALVGLALALMAYVRLSGLRGGIEVVREFPTLQALTFVGVATMLAAATLPLLGQPSAASYGATPGSSETSR